MQKKYQVYRMDFLTRVKYPISSLIRFVQDKKTNKYIIDLDSNLKGRGLYLKVDKNNIQLTLNNKRIAKKVGIENVDKLKKLLLKDGK